MTKLKEHSREICYEQWQSRRGEVVDPLLFVSTPNHHNHGSCYRPAARSLNHPQHHLRTHNITCAHTMSLAHTQYLSHHICHFFTITILRTHNLYLTIFGLTPAQPLSHSQSHTFLTHNLTPYSRKLNQHDRRPFLVCLEPLVPWCSCLQLGGGVVIVD